METCCKQPNGDVHIIHGDIFEAYKQLGTCNKIRRRAYRDAIKFRLEKDIMGIRFTNPVGLAAGFDYNGQSAAVYSALGFGFNTIGTVTAREYRGNNPPRFVRLPKSKSLLINKGFERDLWLVR